MNKVCVVGQGYVGLPLAIAIASVGHEVLGFDIDQKVTLNLNQGNSHIEDILNEDLLSILSSGRYRATSSTSDLRDVDVVIIAVPTPLDENRNPDLSFVKEASSILGVSLGKPCLIINESTSYPGTLRNVIAPTVKKHSKLQLDHEFAISPERVDPGNKKWNIRTTPRLVSGLTEIAGGNALEFYKTFCEEVIKVSTPEVAEAAKLFENTFRQVNIALANEFSTILHALNIPVMETINASATKPYGFMKFLPGLGVGGHCIPVDPNYLAQVARGVGVEPNFIELANKVNLNQPKKIIENVSKRVGNLNGKSILVCGISYKPDISDTRETPVEILLSNLKEFTDLVEWFDPFVKNWKNQESHKIGTRDFDIGIIAVNHTNTDIQNIKQVCRLVFNNLGEVI